MRGAERFVALALLYFSQGLPFGFFSHAVPVLLNRTHPPEIVGLSALLALPWGLKFLWAPFVDRTRLGARFGRRKAIILPVQAATVLALVGLGLSGASETNLTPLLVGFFLVSLLAATQDIAADGLTIDVLAEEERGRGGAIQTGAYRLGMIAGGGGVLAIVDFVGFREAFLMMAAAVGVSIAPLVRLREPAAPPPGPDGPPRATGGALSLLRSFWTRPDAWKILVLLVGFKLGDALAAGMVTRWFVKQGLDKTDIALSRGIVGGFAAVAGAIAGGMAVRALGRRRGLLVAGALQTAAIAMYLGLALAHPAGIGPMSMGVYHAASAVEHALGGAATAALFTRMMDLCRDEARATDYTVQASLLVGVTGIGLVGSGLVTGALGLTGLFAVATVAGVLSPLTIALVWPLTRAEARPSTSPRPTP